MTVRNKMDPTKPRALHVNGGGNESLMGDPSVPWGNSKDEGREKDTEPRDPDVEGTTAAAETNVHHRGSADKAKFNTFGYQRRRKQKVMYDVAAMSKVSSAAAKPGAVLRQVFFSQGESEKNQASEMDGLKQELEAFALPLSLKWRWKEESHGTTLEENWKDIVHSHSTMSKMLRHQQEALWEFICTELIYINKLIIIQDFVIATLVNLHQRGFLLEVTPELLFSNIPSILTAHQLFWQQVIYPMLQEVRGTGKPFDPLAFEAGCLQFHERFSSYQHYCWEEENSVDFTRRQMESNPHFLTYVKWVENHPRCERMRLGDMQAKPHQRITKYPLLLKAVLKNTQDPHAQNTLRGMLSSVNRFLESINDHLRIKDEKLALITSAQRVEGYEVECVNEDIDKHVREVCQFDLTCPIRGVSSEVVRKLLLEENLKIRERKDSKLEVVALLFSDVLLMTKVQKKGDRLRVVRPPLALDRTFCYPLKDGCSFLLVEVGELQSAMNVYIFVASTSERCSRWVSTINQAQETLRNLRQTENNIQREHFKIRQLEAEPATNVETHDMDTEKQLVTQSKRESLMDELTEKLSSAQSTNGIGGLVSREAEAEKQYHPPHGVTPDRGCKWIETPDFPYPDVDYVTEEVNTMDPPVQPAIFRGKTELKGRAQGRGQSTNRDSDSQSVNQDFRRHSDCSKSGDMEAPPEDWGRSKNLRSPGLRRRRQNNPHQSLPVLNGEMRGNSPAPESHHRVLKLASLKHNQGMFSDMHDRVSPDIQTASESELFDPGVYNRGKARRTASIPNMKNMEGGRGAGLHASSPHMLPTVENAFFPKPNGHNALEGLLVRAKERDGLKGRNLKVANLGLRNPPSPSFFSPTPSPSPIDGEKNMRWEEEAVKLFRHRALTVSKGWKEQLVDGDDDDDDKSGRNFQN